MWAKLWAHRFDILATTSAALIALGAGLVYLPAGVIVAGLYGLTIALIGAMSAARRMT